MSDIDKDAKNTLLDLVDGRTPNLTENERHIIAKWFALKSVVQLTNDHDGEVPFSWAQSFYRHKDVPLQWHVRIGRMQQRVGVSLGGAPFTYESRPPLSPFPFRLRSFTFSFAIGDICAQVVAFTEFQRLPLNDRLLFAIWPPQGHPGIPPGFNPDIGRWPPLGGVTEDQFHKMGHDPRGPK